MAKAEPDPLFPASQQELEAWLAKHGGSEPELWVAAWKVHTDRPSVTWPQIVDACLLHGWIDGVRKSLGVEAWKIRLTPRRKGSRWSEINIRRAKALIAEGRMSPAGMAAWEARDPDDERRYAYEREMAVFSPEEERRFRAKPAAWAFWEKTPPSYRRPILNWVTTAKKPETREKRFETLMAACAEGRRIT
jgi:uncharacterized protein YdeI (YjbR/CyaY-like superfamily)